MLPTVTTAGAGVIAYSYGTGPVLGYVRIGMRNGVACYLQADRNAPASARNAWSAIGPVADYADAVAAADAYASHYQRAQRAAGLATVQAAPVEPVASVVGEAAPAGPVYHPLTVRALRIYQDAAKARFTRIPDADADEDYTSGAEWAASEGLRDPVDRLRAYTRDRRALVAAKARAGAPAPAMVPQPVQQQQARARGRAPQPARGERRYVTVRDTETGDVHRVLTSVARVGVAVVIFIPSNRHRQGALGGMLITHDDIRKAWVFNDVAEARRMLSRNRAPGERVIRAELVADPAPAIVPLGGRYVALADGGVEWVADAPTMVPQPAQQQQAKARAAVAAPSDKAVTWTEFWACYAQCATRQYEAGTLPYPRMAPVGMSHSEAGTWLADMASRTVSSGQPFAHDGPVLRAALRSFGQAARTKRDTLAFLAGLVR